MSKKKKQSRDRLVIHDNVFTQTSLSIITNAQNSFLYAVLSEAKEGIMNERGNYVVNAAYSDLRKMTGRPNSSKREIDDILRTLLGTTVELQLDPDDDTRTIANLFAAVHINEARSKSVQIELSELMSQRLIIDPKKGYTAVKVGEFSSIKSPYGQEIYRHLRRFASTGRFMIGANQWREHFNVSDTISDYEVIRGQIMPAYNANRIYFEDLNVNVKLGENKLPPTIIFTFKRQVGVLTDE